MDKSIPQYLQVLVQRKVRINRGPCLQGSNNLLAHIGKLYKSYSSAKSVLELCSNVMRGGLRAGWENASVAC